MKKKILLVLILSLCLMMPEIKAKVVLKEEVENGTYIIGKYMFTRTDQLEAGYTGALTTPLIMLASKTTKDELKNQTIYYKSLFGEWKNGLTNETIAVPDYFEIENRDLIDILPTPQLECTFDTDEAVCVTSFNYKNNDGTTSLVYVYTDGRASQDFSHKDSGVMNGKYEFYFLKDAKGNYVSGDVPVRYKNGKFYGGASSTSELILKAFDRNEALNVNYDSEQTYHIVSRFLDYTNGEYSEYSNIVTNIGTADYSYFPDNFKIMVTVNEDEKVAVTEDGNYYNVRFDLICPSSRGDLYLGSDEKYKFKSYEVYGDMSAEDNLVSTDYENVNNLLYMKNFYEIIAQEKYTKARRFANADFNAYLVAEANLTELDSSDSASTAYSVSHTGIYGRYIAKIKACNNDETSCFYVTTPALIYYDERENVKYGDINGDGVVNTSDLKSLEDLLLGIADDYNYANADINNDGKIDYIDLTLIERFIGGMYSDTLPNKKITDYAWYGDVNEDGKITTADFLRIGKMLSSNFEVNITKQVLKNADVNNDGKINYVDQMLIGIYLSNPDNPKETKSLPYFPITSWLLYGDVNDDGLLDGNDVTYLSKHLDGSIELTSQQLKNADVNADGRINQMDYDILLKNVMAQDSSKTNMASTTPLS